MNFREILGVEKEVEKVYKINLKKTCFLLHLKMKYKVFQKKRLIKYFFWVNDDDGWVYTKKI